MEFSITFNNFNCVDIVKIIFILDYIHISVTTSTVFPFNIRIIRISIII